MEMSPKPTSMSMLVGVQKKQLLIPPYQRPYAWEEEHFTELTDDIQATGGADHFMGTIVLNTEDSWQPVVIDGQQRICTLMLLLAAVRDAFWKIGSDEHKRMQFSHMQNQWPDGDREFKLRTGEMNWPVFLDFILRGPTDPLRKQWSDFEKLPRKERKLNKRLYENSLRAVAYIATQIAPLNDSGKLQRLKQVEETIVERFKFLIIEVPKMDDAFLIFETLNDRGLALSAGDLLKNHLLSLASKKGIKIEDMAEEWDEMIESLNSADLTKFLRHYLLAKHSKVTKEDVFGLFKQEAKDGAAELFEKLKVMAKHYGELVEPPADTPADIARSLNALQQLRAAICYSVLLPAKEYLQEEDFRRILEIIEVLTFRYSSVCGKASNVLELTYHKAAKELESSRGSNLADAEKELLKLMPSSEEFRAAFVKQSMGNKDVCSYMFRRIEDGSDDEKSTKPPAKVHLEHILPKKPSDEWKIYMGAEFDKKFIDYVDRWGNLTLLSGKRNQSISNGNFAKKKEAYAASSVQLTKKIASEDKWSFDLIDSRQKELAEAADKLWSVEVMVFTKA